MDQVGDEARQFTGARVSTTCCDRDPPRRPAWNGRRLVRDPSAPVGVMLEEAQHLARDIRAAGIDIGAGRIAARPGMARTVHQPVLDHRPPVGRHNAPRESPPPPSDRAPLTTSA
jgi:hypothetical protein